MAALSKDRGFKTMISLSYIANAIWGVLFLILLVACIGNSQAIIDATKDRIAPTEIFGSLIALFLILSLVVVALCIICIIGLNLMKRKTKKGFFLYAVANACWALLQIYIGSDDSFTFLASGLVSIVFIFYFTVQLPKFK